MTMKNAPQRSASVHQRRGSRAGVGVMAAAGVDGFIISLRSRLQVALCQFRHLRRPERTGRFLSPASGVITGNATQTRPSERPPLVSADTLSRARAGDADAFRELIDPYRRELQLHCYRILGSLQDAEDQMQETHLAAWRGLKDFEGRSSVRAWLYQIATSRCLNALRARRRRPQEVPSMLEPPEPTRRVEPLWLEPYPDAL